MSPNHLIFEQILNLFNWINREFESEMYLMKKKIILTIAFAISLLPMLLNQYGGMKGVQEISGLINLYNPIGIISVLFFIIGVWIPFKNKKINNFWWIRSSRNCDF